MAGDKQGNWLKGAAIAAAGAVLVGLWQGLGTGLAEMGLDWFQGVEAAATDSREPDRVSGGDGSKPPAVVEPAPSPHDGAAPEFVAMSVPMSLSGVGNGGDEGAACREAIQSIARRASDQCQKMVIENSGSSYRIDEVAKSCTSCGPVGGSWRCVAASNPQCVVMKEGD